MDFGLSSVERYLPSSRFVYRQNKLPKTIIYLVTEALAHLPAVLSDSSTPDEGKSDPQKPGSYRSRAA